MTNDEIEDYIGKAGHATSDLKDLILANCGIKTRHYAIDKSSAHRHLECGDGGQCGAHRRRARRTRPRRVELLSAATTLPDVMGPGHASMVHGELGYGPLEIATAHGICSSGMMALKNAYLQVAIGEKRNAISVASEFASRRFKSTPLRRDGPVSEDGSLPMETAFLRYMLSDGAGAAVIESAPSAIGDQPAHRLDLADVVCATPRTACMFFGSPDNACAKTWGDYPTASAAAADGALALRQKLSLLPHLVRVGLDEYERLLATGQTRPVDADLVSRALLQRTDENHGVSEFARRGIAAGPPRKVVQQPDQSRKHRLRIHFRHPRRDDGPRV